MTRLEMECVRALPAEYVRDGIAVMQRYSYVVVISSIMPILRYDPVTRRFRRWKRES